MDDLKDVPAVRVRFYPQDSEEYYDGTVIDEITNYYLVIPDDDLHGDTWWSKESCKVLR